MTKTGIDQAFADKVRSLSSYLNADGLEYLYSQFKAQDVSKLTELLHISGIDPLKYLTKVPPYFAGNYDYTDTIKIPEHYTEIGEFAFLFATSIEKVRIGKSVETIGRGAFSCCYKLKEVYFHGDSELITVGAGAFQNCHDLEEMYLPDSVEYIDELAFSNCHYLRKIYLPKNLKSIGRNAFSDCNLLNAYYDGPIDDFRKVTLGNNGLYYCHAKLNGQWLLYKL